MKIALIQQHATADRQANRQRGVEAVEEAVSQGAQVVAFAELAFDHFWPQHHATPETLALAETIPGPTTDLFIPLAKKHSIVIVLNLFERAGETTFDASPVIDADGSILGTTRMVHITDYDWFHEQGYYAAPPQREPPFVYHTRYGRIGVAICYDRHYPEYMRALAVNGTEVVFIPQAGAVGEWPDGLYEAELRVAAFQNGYFTALCNRVGQEEKVNFAGESFVCDPAGNVIARAQQGTDEILYATLDLNEVEGSHAKKLFMRDRRPELYGAWLGR